MLRALLLPKTGLKKSLKKYSIRCVRKEDRSPQEYSSRMRFIVHSQAIQVSVGFFVPTVCMITPVKFLIFFGSLFNWCVHKTAKVVKAQDIFAENLENRNYAGFLFKRIAEELTADKKAFRKESISKLGYHLPLFVLYFWRVKFTNLGEQ